MAAGANDKFKKLSKRWVGQIGAAGVSDATVQTIPLASVTNLPTDTAVVVVIDRVDSNGAASSGLEETIIGVVSGSNLINCIRGAEGTAQSHNGGAVVEVLVTAKGWNDLIDGLLVGHNQDGSHGASVIVASNISASAVTQGALNFTVATSDGWISDSNTWTYGSTDGHTFVVTVNADLTLSIQRGDKVKFTNNSTTFFGIVTKTPTFGAGTTTLTIYGGTTYTVANSAITAPSYSHSRSPFGFDSNPVIWSETLSDSSDRTQASISSGTWYNITSVLSLAVPIGAWKLSYGAQVQLHYGSAASDIEAQATLSTANNSASDTDFIAAAHEILNSSSFLYHAPYLSREKYVLLTSKTTYYLNVLASQVSGTSDLVTKGSITPTRITAVCAFL